MKTTSEVFITLVCTLAVDHHGDHYDGAFSKGWLRNNG